jgi:sRNA-binding carbon storage regulator CsrA
MLVLTVRPGETVTLDGGITVAFIERRNGQSIRLGFDAPAAVGISRPGTVADTRDERKPNDRTESD